MGRSRAVSRSADDDSNPSKSKRKRIASGTPGAESVIGPAGQGQGEVKGLNETKIALYHCNYCNKDITGIVRIKCAACQDFDLCIECFSVGAEITPHKNNHPYRVMDNLSFPLICPDWNVDEEMLLLEGIEMYGFGNWTEVAEHVGSKTRSHCINHYNSVYMNSPCFPLPDLSHVMGKTKEELELLSMAKGQCHIKQEFSPQEDLQQKDNKSVFSARVSQEGALLEVPGGGDTFSGASNMQPNKEVAKEETRVDRSIGEKKPRISAQEGPSMTELSSYNFKREEFEIEYDNDAEQLLADMEFRETDIDAERELKLQVLQIYSKRLDERKRRKDFVLERNLLYPDPFEKNLSPEEREIYNRFKVFARFHSKEEHEELLKSVIEEHRILKRIEELQEARAAGCRTSAEANKFLNQKREKEAAEIALRIESAQAGPSSKAPKPNSLKGELEVSPRGVGKGSTGHQTIGKDSFQAFSAKYLDDWDITGFAGADLLSENEKHLCRELRILPSHYLKMLQTMSVEIMRGKLTKKTDAHSLFKVDASKVDRVYDMLVTKGIAQA